MMKPCRHRTNGIQLLLLLAYINISIADYGDYTDPTFECPARTTCPTVCVANVSDCPTTCLFHQKLCLDGTCVGQNETCSAQATSCPYQCAPIACAKTIDYLPTCQDTFAAWYANATQCGALEFERIPLVTFREAPFVFCYCWIAFIVGVVITWCFFNQILFPVNGSTRTLDGFVKSELGAKTCKTSDEVEIAPTSSKMKALRKLSEDMNNQEESMQEDNYGWNQQQFDDDTKDLNNHLTWTQTGYRAVRLPMLLYSLVLITLLGIHVLLGVFTLFYYVQQDAITFLPKYFKSEIQSLQAFEISWGVGVIIILALQWPESIESLFLRRSLLSHASHVAVFVAYQTEAEDQPKNDSSATLRRIRYVLVAIHAFYTKVMAFIFCDTTRSHTPGTTAFVPVETEEDGTRFFCFRYRRYTYDDEQGKFVPAIWNVGSTLGDYQAAVNGLSEEDITIRRGLVGTNCIRVKQPNFMCGVVEEFGKPFYTYQCFIVWSWFPFWNFVMGVVYSAVVVIGGLAVATHRYRQDRTLAKLSETKGEVTVLRDGVFSLIPQTELVPGDVITIRPGVACCDMVLVRSDGILMDESALTGESTPVFKRAVDPTDSMVEYDKNIHKKHTISAGTVVLESNEAACDLAVVARTGSFTAKGKLLQEILSSERHQFKFDTEVKVVIIVLCIEAIIAFSVVVYLLEDAPVFGFFYGIYVVGTCLPPLLPTVFTVSVGISDQRLIKKRIAVANSEGILVAGKVTKVFFDKTGTLTKQGLEFVSAQSSRTSMDASASSMSNELGSGMASCHSLTLTKHGQLVGNSVDLMMFTASGATLNKIDGSEVHLTDSSGDTFKIVKLFDFDHHLALQSVVVSYPNGRLVAFVKGSGESIKRCCMADTLPSDFDRAARQSAKAGLYQIAMAMKVLSYDGFGGLDLADISRADIEYNLTFLGNVNFKNVLRDETPGVIEELKGGDCQPAIITGDHVLTGINIAKEAGIVEPSRSVLVCTSVDNGNAIWTDENDCHVPLPSMEELKANFDLAVTGKVWNELLLWQPQNAERLAPYIRVFGRCTPNDKVSVVATFVKQGFITLMCGDGGNDCGALKTAHVGIALSDAEASLVSPFTSLDKCITSVPEVLKEGRCALASSLASYKFIILYGQLETINQIICAYFKVSFGIWNWFFMDGLWTISLAFALPFSMAARDLAPTRPASSLLGVQTVSSAGGVLLLNFIFFAGALFLLFRQDWYQCRQWTNTDVSQISAIGDNYESEVTWLVSGYQYISSAMAFNYGYEFRRGWLKNYVFVILIAAFTAMHVVTILIPGQMSCIFRANCDNSIAGADDPIQNVYNTTMMPAAFRWKLLVYIIGNTVAVQVYEYYIVHGIGKKVGRYIKAKKARNKVEAPLEPVASATHQEIVVGTTFVH